MIVGHSSFMCFSCSRCVKYNVMAVLQLIQVPAWCFCGIKLRVGVLGFEVQHEGKPECTEAVWDVVGGLCRVEETKLDTVLSRLLFRNSH